MRALVSETEEREEES